MRTILLALILIALASPALASDGAIDINQTCALQTGCVTGDGPGFPVVLAQSGSYRLTSDLTVAVGGGIVATADGVSIDLNGFTVAGPVVCTGEGASLSCSGPLGGSGISFSAPGMEADRFSVRNGRVTGFGVAGISGGSRGRIRNVQATGNGEYGIRLENGSIVTDSSGDRGGAGGVFGTNAVILDHVGARGSFFNGIVLEHGGLVVAGRTTGNGVVGILASDGAVVTRAISGQNGSYGIKVRAGSLVSENTTFANGVPLFGSGLRSEAGGGSSMDRNVTDATGPWAIEAVADDAYRNNTLKSDSFFAISGPGVDLGGNFCNGNATCP